MNLYDDKGYLNIPLILNVVKTPWVLFIGGRGTGKTYPCLKYLIESHIKFFFLRRTHVQFDVITRKEFSPFKRLNYDMGWGYGFEKTSKYLAVCKNLLEDKEESEIVGYAGALSTISNIRGFDAYDVEFILFDEYIPEPHEKKIVKEGFAFLNAYETINRNRELEGKPPVRMVGLTNSNDISNPIFQELKLVNIAKRMMDRKQEVYINDKRGLSIIYPQNSPISKKKASTTLYKLVGENSDFSEMSLGNRFEVDTTSIISSRPIKEYRPIVKLGEVVIYAHRSRSELYVSKMNAGGIPTYPPTNVGVEKFKKGFFWIWEFYLNGTMIFEDYDCEILLTSYLGKNII